MPKLIAMQSMSPLLLVDYTTSRGLSSEQIACNRRAEALRTSLKWINVQATLLDICIAFHPLDLPPYVILEIVDWFPFWSTHVNHKKKIDCIIQIKRLCDSLIEKRVKSTL
jgi:hypothetical protein